MIRAPYDARRRPDKHGFAAITAREQDVLRAYVRSGHHDGIAKELGISLQTVKNHTRAILRTLDLSALGQAAVLYERWTRDQWPEIDRRMVDRRRKDRRATGTPVSRTCSCGCGCNLEMGGDCAFCAVGSHP